MVQPKTKKLNSAAINSKVFSVSEVPNGIAKSIIYDIMNHDSGFIIGIAMIFSKTLLEHTPKSHLKKHPSA